MNKRFYAESDGGGVGDGHGTKAHYVVDRYADPLGDQRRTDCESRIAARNLAQDWNTQSPWPAWDDIQAARDGYIES